MVNTANTFKASQAAAGNFGKRNAPIESALGSELAVNPPTIPMVDHRGNDTETKAIEGLEKAYGLGMGVFMLDLFTGISAKVFGGLAGLVKQPKAHGFIDKWLRSPIWALRNTEIGNMGDLRYNFTESAEGLVRKAGDTAGADKLASKLSERSIKPLADVGDNVASYSKSSGVWGAIDNVVGAPFRAFAKWRVGVTDHKASIHMNNALGVPNKGGMFGFFQKLGGEAPNVEGLPGFDDASMKKLTGLLKDPSKIDEVVQDLTKYATKQLDVANSKSASEAERKAAKAAYETASKIANSLREAKINLLGKAGYASAVGKNLKQMAKSLPKAAGRVSVFHALIAAGVAAGVTASWMTTGRENRLGKQALKDMAADVYGVDSKHVTKDMISGENAHPLVKEASKIYKKQARGRYISSTTHTAGEVVLLATLRSIGGMASSVGVADAAKGSTGVMNSGFGPVIPVMAAQMGLPALGEMMVPENQTLNAYAMLKKAEKEGQPMEAAEKTYLVRQLMAAVPAVARHSGHNNTMVPAVAAEIVSRGMNASEIVKTISDPKRFVTLTNEVIEKENAKEAAAKKEAQAKEKAPEQPETMLQATKPAKSLNVSDAEYQGRISQEAAQQRA